MNIKTKVEYVNYGLGNLIDNTIYLNRNLLRFPKLHNKVYNHELDHLNGINKDWIEPLDFKLLLFCIFHPSTWIHFIPIWYLDGKIIYSKTLLIHWFTLMTSLIIFIFILLKWTL